MRLAVSKENLSFGEAFKRVLVASLRDNFTYRPIILYFMLGLAVFIKHPDSAWDAVVGYTTSWRFWGGLVAVLVFDAFTRALYWALPANRDKVE